MSVEREYDNVSIDDDGFDASLVLTSWDHTSDESPVKRVLRIAVEDIPDFMAQVVSRGTHALSTAARRLEVGHCETCANTGLVDVEKHGRKSNDYCPDCRNRWPSQPFKAAPQIGRKNTDG